MSLTMLRFALWSNSETSLGLKRGAWWLAALS